MYPSKTFFIRFLDFRSDSFVYHNYFCYNYFAFTLFTRGWGGFPQKLNIDL